MARICGFVPQTAFQPGHKHSVLRFSSRYLEELVEKLKSNNRHRISCKYIHRNASSELFFHFDIDKSGFKQDNVFIQQNVE
jgi:hypothetical protein